MIFTSVRLVARRCAVPSQFLQFLSRWCARKVWGPALCCAVIPQGPPEPRTITCNRVECRVLGAVCRSVICHEAASLLLFPLAPDSHSPRPVQSTSAACDAAAPARAAPVAASRHPRPSHRGTPPAPPRRPLVRGPPARGPPVSSPRRRARAPRRSRAGQSRSCASRCSQTTATPTTPASTAFACTEAAAARRRNRAGGLRLTMV